MKNSKTNYRNLRDMSDEPENNLKSEIGKRIRAKREGLKLSRQFVAEQLGVALSTLQAWENEDREPSATHILKLSECLKVSVEWLITGDEKTESLQLPASISSSTAVDVQGNHVDLEEFVFVPRYNVSASAGYGAWNDDESPMFTVSFRRYWVINHLKADPRKLSVISVVGDSMMGVLNDKDIILVNHDDRDPREGIYVIRLDSQLLVKRVQRLPGSQLRISSTNPAFEPFIIDLDNIPSDFDVVGKVVWYGRVI
ncbi:XRE family transcriptional regulator [Klebsiella variicola]|uniref:XRE family transcriptional regulator n=2 Tax=Klebsiella pneumoniae complex TaxID=3390273 RepID=UPI001F121BB6|nr:helix-turn-helix transcriptional regulator [Klebsiella variicola]